MSSRCQYRWCLTGTPIHNSLDDYGALLSIIGVHPFSNKTMFDFWISNPVKAKTPYALKTLQDLVKATCLRRTKRATAESFQIPPKNEKIEVIELSEAEQKLYDFFKQKAAKLAKDPATKRPGWLKGNSSKDSNILYFINTLRRICNHGEQLLPSSAVEIWKGGAGASLDWQTMQALNKRCKVCQGDIESAFSSFESNGLCSTCCEPDSDSLSIDHQINERGAAEHFEFKRSKLDLPLLRPSAKLEALVRNICAEQAFPNIQEPIRPTKRRETPKNHSG